MTVLLISRKLWRVCCSGSLWHNDFSCWVLLLHKGCLQHPKYLLAMVTFWSCLPVLLRGAGGFVFIHRHWGSTGLDIGIKKMVLALGKFQLLVYPCEDNVIPRLTLCSQEGGDLEMCQWLHKNSCHQDAINCTSTTNSIAAGYSSGLRYGIDHGCPVHQLHL